MDIEIIGRIDDIYNVGGRSISLNYIEVELTKQFNLSGSRLAAYFTPSDNSYSYILWIAIDSECEVACEQLAVKTSKFLDLPKSIIRIISVTNLPLTSNGKIARNKMKSLLMKHGLRA